MTELDDRDPPSDPEVRCETCGYLWPTGTPADKLDSEYTAHLASDRHRNAVEQLRAERTARANT